MNSSLHILLIFGLTGSVVSAQSGGDQPNSQPDPIAIAAAHVLKGNTNAEQRKNIRKQWLITAAQELEDILRTKAFREIIDFVTENRDLFVDVYAALRKVKGSITLIQRAKDVAVLQADLLILFGESADLLATIETFSEEELRMIVSAIATIIDDTEDNFTLLVSAFDGLFDTSMSDIEKIDLLATVHQRLTKNRAALLQLQRYVSFMDANRRSSGGTSAADLLFQPVE